jgi:hypothetical protein
VLARQKRDYCPVGELCAMGAGEKNQLASEGSGMHLDPKEGHPAMDYSEHEKTYKLFCKLTGLTILGAIAIMAALAVFVA